MSDFLNRVRSMADSNVPYVHQGRSIHGVDCAGLLYVGFNLTDDLLKNYPEHIDSNAQRILIALLDQRLQRVTGKLQPGDIMLCKIKNTPQHIVVYDEPLVIHAARDTGCVCRTRPEKWLNRLAGVWRE